jgi:hypothetical protein
MSLVSASGEDLRGPSAGLGRASRHERRRPTCRGCQRGCGTHSPSSQPTGLPHERQSENDGVVGLLNVRGTAVRAAGPIRIVRKAHVLEGNRPGGPTERRQSNVLRYLTNCRRDAPTWV